MDMNDFKKLPLMGILRGIEKNAVEPLCGAIVSSGLRTVEIAMNTPNAPELVKHMSELSKNRFSVGAGTVLTKHDLKNALDAGATFIVLPVLVPEVVDSCVKKGVPVFPGALTPQEIYAAWRAGATMVKVFPAKFFGPEYIKEIKAPFADVEILACGGITPESIGSFFSCGASAVAFGGSVFKKEWIKARKFSLIEKSIKALVEKALAAKTE